MRWNLPNILTLFRILAAPTVVIVFLIFPRPLADWCALIIFLSASLTDYFDGFLARRWNQQSAFGAMLDPIADKAMVILAFLALSALFGMSYLIIIPATVILLREIFVSGLREFLGNKVKDLAVTKIAKWKTTYQMIAIAVLFAYGIFSYNFMGRVQGMDNQLVLSILAGETEDDIGLKFAYDIMRQMYWIGIVLLWLAAILTLITGFDYLRKARPFLENRDDNH